MEPIAAAAMVMIAAAMVAAIGIGAIGGVVTAFVRAPLAWGALVVVGIYLAVLRSDGPLQLSFAPIGLFPLVLTFLVAALTTLQLQTRWGLQRRWAAPAGLMSALAVGFLYGLLGIDTLAERRLAWPLAGLALGVVATLVIVWAMERWNDGWISRAVERALDRARHPERYPSEARTRHAPERGFIVRVSETEIVCERPDGAVERLAWPDLRIVEIITTGNGPYAPDVFWVLSGTSGGCAIPQGATGDHAMLERLQTLPGFDNKAVIEAMGSSVNRRFLCWQRTP
jgi:hypothetical protein